MQRLFCSIIFLYFVFFNIPVFSENSNDLENMLRESRTRAILVKNVQKAVVHIKVEKIKYSPLSPEIFTPLKDRREGVRCLGIPYPNRAHLEIVQDPG